MSLRLLCIVVAVFAGLGASRARAQDRSQPLLGERDLGMAGAVAASARGPTSAYYNPSGLGVGGRSAFGGGLSLRTFRAYGIADGYVSSAGVEDLDDATLDSLSVYLGGMVAFGERDELGNRRHALGVGTLVRSSVDRSFFDTAGDPALELAASLDIVERRVDRWYYASYAVRPLTELALGLTAAISARSETYLESTSDGVGLGDESEGARLSARDVDVDLQTLHLVLRAGATARLTDWLQAGLVFQAPGIPLSASGTASFQRLSVEDPDSSLFRRQLESDGEAPAPWELRGGLYARLAPELGLGLDVGLVGAVGSENEPWQTLGQEVPRDRGRPAATFFAAERVSGIGFEAALGAEIDAWREVPIRAGVLFERSGNARAEGPSETPRLDARDRLGATLSVGVHDDFYDFTVGAAYAYGWGTASRPNPDPLGPAYVPAAVESHQITLVLSGVTGAAADLALEAYRSLSTQENDEDDEDDEDDEGEDTAPRDADAARAAEPEDHDGLSEDHGDSQRGDGQPSEDHGGPPRDDGEPSADPSRDAGRDASEAPRSPPTPGQN